MSRSSLIVLAFLLVPSAVLSQETPRTGDPQSRGTKGPASRTPGLPFVVLYVSDAEERVEQFERDVQVPLKHTRELGHGYPDWGWLAEVPIARGSLVAQPGYKIASVRPSKKEREVRVIRAPDGASAEFLIEPAPEKNQTDLQVTVREERSIDVAVSCKQLKEVKETVFSFGTHYETKFLLPEAPKRVSSLKRRLVVEIRQPEEDGKSRVICSAVDIRLPWSIQIPLGSGGISSSLSSESDHIRCVVGWLFR
jgi:hypothetical protein